MPNRVRPFSSTNRWSIHFGSIEYRGRDGQVMCPELEHQLDPNWDKPEKL